MDRIGTSGVVDYTNTTTASATGVVATGGIAGPGVSAFPTPPNVKYLSTINHSLIVTLSNKFLVTQNG